MGSGKKINLHFIPNTHLDREWTIDYQHTRKLTVEFIDTLIEVMKKVPQYIFLLDSQVVPLEDYLEIRPNNKAIIKKFVKEGRLNIGPWYTAPDMNCLLGESVVRNLLYGHKVGKEYGGVMKVGYTPFGFVHISQLPQIYKGFGIDVCYFYRGIDPEKVATKAEFLWESPDGTTVLASRMSRKPRYNFYFDVWRQAYYKGMEYRLKRRYDWCEGQLPFKLCNEEYRFDQGALLKSARKLDEETLKTCFRKLIEVEKRNFATSEIAFMHGMDTSMPDIREDEVLRLCQKYLARNEKFFYSSLPYYTACLKRELKGKKLKKLRGEMIAPGDKVDENLRLTFVNVVSTRVRQKLLTAKAEALLERFAEPFATIAYLLCGEWPAEYLELAWKYFLKCTPHDTIGGCGIDRIEEDATYRLNQAISLSNVVLKESLGKIQSIISTYIFNKEDVIITVFNPSPFSRSEVISFYLDIPQEINMENFAFYDVEGGKVIEHEKSPTGNIGKIFRDKTDLALFCETQEYKVSFTAENIPPLGYKTFVVRKTPIAEKTTFRKDKISTQLGIMENEFIKVKINDDGTVDILNKDSNFWYRRLNYFEDTGEAGHPWTHFAPEKDEVIVSLSNTKARTKVIENNALLSCYEVYIKLMVPETTYYDEKKRIYNPCPKGAVRSKKKRPIDIHLYYTLRRGAKSLEVRAKVTNTCENHRLRVMFPTKLANAKYSYAETPYDVVERVIERRKGHPFYGIQNPDYAFLRFVAVSDNKNGFAFISNGLHEYQVTEDEKRVLAVTLIRAVEVRLCTTALWDKVESKSKLSQSLGEHEFCYYLYPYVGKWCSSDIYKEVERLNYPLIVCQSGAMEKVEGGRDLLPTASYSFFSIDGTNVALSALKKSEYDGSVILRLFNPSDKSTSGRIQFFKKIKSAFYINMDEETTRQKKKINFSNGTLLVHIPPKKIVTLSVFF